MCSETILQVEGVSKCFSIYARPEDRLKQMLGSALASKQRYYDEFWALQDISFTLGRGETVGIVGRNGSGKSSLLQILCGTLSPSKGQVRVAGRIAALLELGAGFNPEFSGRDNVFLNAAILGLSHTEITQIFPQVLAFSELDEFIDRPVKTYSSGMYARLAFAIAIHVQPDILVVDEALAVGDSRFVAKCMRKIREIQKSGCSLLFVSHDISTVRALCQRVIWLDKGSLIADGDVFPITGRYMEMMCQDQDDDLAQLTTEHTPGPLPLAQLGKPYSHWGSHRGLIVDATLCNAQGQAQDLIHYRDLVQVKVRLDLPADFSRQNLSVAMSIKDLKGTDLIVSTTHDFQPASFPESAQIEVIFSFTNYLVTGKYLLVLALENRQHRDIHYYEYIEGAHYFSSLAEQRLFGQFHPDIQQIVRPAMPLNGQITAQISALKAVPPSTDDELDKQHTTKRLHSAYEVLL